MDRVAPLKPTCIVANTRQINNRANATANTAPITLRITAKAFISDGQSEMNGIKYKDLIGNSIGAGHGGHEFSVSHSSGIIFISMCV